MADPIEKFLKTIVENHDKRLNSVEITMTQLSQTNGQNANDIKELKLAQSNMATRIDDKLAKLDEKLTSLQLAMARNSWVPSIITMVGTAIITATALTLIGKIK